MFRKNTAVMLLCGHHMRRQTRCTDPDRSTRTTQVVCAHAIYGRVAIIEMKDAVDSEGTGELRVLILTVVTGQKGHSTPLGSSPWLRVFPVKHPGYSADRHPSPSKTTPSGHWKSPDVPGLSECETVPRRRSLSRG